MDTVATKADTGTALLMSMSKQISIIGIILPAPERPPAFETQINIPINTNPEMNFTGDLANCSDAERFKTLASFLVVTSTSVLSAVFSLVSST